MRRQMMIAGAIAATLLAGCDGAIAPSDVTPSLTVQGFLIANQPVDSIVVSQSMPIDAYYSDSTARVAGATVTIAVDGRTFLLAEDPARRGVYTLAADSLIVRSRKTYVLTVVANGITATASTVVPDSFSLTSVIPDTLPYVSGEAISSYLPITWSPSPNRVAYAVSVEAQDTSIYRIDGADTLWNQRIEHPYGGRGLRFRQVTAYALQILEPKIELPWVLFNWFGRQRVTVFAMDSNFFDFMRMIGSGGRQYNPILNHVHGGIGVFGSAATQQRDVFLKE